MFKKIIVAIVLMAALFAFTEAVPLDLLNGGSPAGNPLGAVSGVLQTAGGAGQILDGATKVAGGVPQLPQLPVVGSPLG